MKTTFLLLSLLLVVVNGTNKVANPCRVLVIGSGPAGLLASHCLLSRQNKLYDVSIYESREDPRKTESGPRAYSLGLNIRGQSAIKHFDTENRSKGLWAEIFSKGVESDAFFLHIGKKKFQIRKPSPKTEESERKTDAVPPTLLIPRNKLSEAMLNILERNYGATNRLRVEFNSRLESVDLNRKVAIINDQEQPYDLIIGSDGVQSCVRGALIAQRGIVHKEVGEKPFISEEVVLPGQYKVMQQPFPSTLESDAVHAMENGKAGYGLFLIPAPGNRTCVLLNWRGTETPFPVQPDAEFEMIQEHIDENYPLFGKPTIEAITQMKLQDPSVARTVRCSRYHDVSGRALLIGDAAHSTGGTLGQGANSALMDVVALDKCLDETNDDIPSALELFSKKQVPEGLALWKLLQLPPKGLLAPIYGVLQLLQGLLSKFFPFVGKPTQILLSQTLTPFSEIVKKNAIWMKFAVRRDQLVGYEP